MHLVNEAAASCLDQGTVSEIEVTPFAFDEVPAAPPHISGWVVPDGQTIKTTDKQELSDLLHGDLVPTRERLIYDIAQQLRQGNLDLLPACTPCTQTIMSKTAEAAAMLNIGRFSRDPAIAAHYISEQVHVCDHLSPMQRVVKSAGTTVSSRLVGIHYFLNN